MLQLNIFLLCLWALGATAQWNIGRPGTNLGQFSDKASSTTTVTVFTFETSVPALVNVSASATSSLVDFPIETGTNFCGTKLPGLVLRPCVSKSSSLDAASINLTNVTTVSSAYTTVFPTTLTITETSITSKLVSGNRATGLCFWDEQKILTPCTGMVAATAVATISKSSAGNDLHSAVFEELITKFKNLLNKMATSGEWLNDNFFMGSGNPQLPCSAERPARFSAINDLINACLCFIASSIMARTIGRWRGVRHFLGAFIHTEFGRFYIIFLAHQLSRLMQIHVSHDWESRCLDSDWPPS